MSREAQHVHDEACGRELGDGDEEETWKTFACQNQLCTQRNVARHGGEGRHESKVGSRWGIGKGKAGIVQSLPSNCHILRGTRSTASRRHCRGLCEHTRKITCRLKSNEHYIGSQPGGRRGIYVCVGRWPLLVLKPYTSWDYIDICTRSPR